MDYVLIIITCILGILGTWSEVHKNEKRNFKAITIIALTIISALVAITLEYKKEKKTSAEALQNKTTSDSLLTVLNSTNKNIYVLSDSLNKQKKELQDDNFKLSHALTNAALTISKNILGTDEPCFMKIGTSTTGMDWTTLVNDSKLSAYNLFVTVIDYDKLKLCERDFDGKDFSFDDTCFNQCAIVFSINEITPQGENILTNTPHYKERGLLQVVINSRTGVYIQQIVYERYQGVLISTSRILQVLPERLKYIKTIAPVKGAKFNINFDKLFNITSAHYKIGLNKIMKIQ